MNRREVVQGAAAVAALASVGVAPAAPPWQVFVLNDCDYYVARSLEEALATAGGDWGCPPDELEKEGLIEDARALTDDELTRHSFADCDENDRLLPETRRSFKEELARRVAAGLSKPEYFAGSEW